MKVVHVETGRHLYGGALQVVFLLQGLRHRPGRHILVCPQGSAVAQAARDAVDALYTTPMRGDLDPSLLVRLRRILRKERPDLVHLHSRRGADTWGALAARLERIPVVLSRRVDNPEARWLVRLKYRLYDRVITISDGIRRVLLAEGVAPEKVICVRSAVDTERYRPGGDRAWFRREFELSHDEKTVAMIAQFIERKGHRVLLHAIPEVVRAHPRTRFVLFGMGPLEPAIRRMSQEVGTEQRVLFAGFREDLERILPCVDLVVHPAFMEGLGVALLQAAACGVPIVGSRAGGIPEIVQDRVNGILVEPGKPEALAAAITELLADTETARRYGEHGRQLALESFSTNRMVEGNERVYAELRGR